MKTEQQIKKHSGRSYRFVGITETMGKHIH